MEKLTQNLPRDDSPSDSKQRHADMQYADIQDALEDLRELDARKGAKGRLRRWARLFEPVLDFLIMYSPAVDIMVQYDMNPSALVWGALKMIIQESSSRNWVNYYCFIERTLSKLADILSTTSRYKKIFEWDVTVQTALEDLYIEVLSFLQNMRTFVARKSLMIVFKCMFRPIDLELHDHVQRLYRRNEIFNKEIELAHRKHLEDHMKEQRIASSHISKLVVQRELNPLTPSRDSPNGETRRSIMVWLGQLNFSETYHRATRTRTPDTGLWLLNHPLFEAWMGNSSPSFPSNLLWIQGPLGSGKTVLSTTVIDYLKAQKKLRGTQEFSLAYIHGDPADKSAGAAFNICISAISQLLAQAPEVPQILIEMYQVSRCQGRSRVSEDDDVYGLFHELLLSSRSSYLVLDGLDELPGVSNIIRWLSDEVRSSSCSRLAVFSRDIISVRKELGDSPSVKMDAGLIQLDVEKYLSAAIGSLPCHEAMGLRVLHILSHKSQGMFLFASISIQTLQSAVDEENLLNMLNSLPEGINEMYDKVLERLSKEPASRKSLAQKVFRCMCTSMRPLTWSELCFTLSWNPSQRIFQRDKIPFQEAILELCRPLIACQPEEVAPRFVHFSIYEYLCLASQLPSKSKNVDFLVKKSEGHKEMASMTLACVAANGVSSSVTANESSRPLITYATKYWCEHLAQSPFEEDLYKQYLNFNKCSERRSTWIVRWLLLEEWSFPIQHISKLLKSVQEWVCCGGLDKPSTAAFLGDIQRVLINLDELQSKSGPTSPTTTTRTFSNFERLVCVRDMAREYTMAGAIEDGVELFEQALKRAESSKAGITLRSCWLLNGLGILYDQQNRTQLAKETQWRALNLQEASTSSNSLDIALTINELGRLARHLGVFEEAEILHRRALAALLQNFPEADLHVTWTKNTLARALLKQDRPGEAIALHEQVLEVQSQRLGSSHPHTLWTLSDIARCYLAQNKVEDAITAQREVTEKRKQTLGIKHPDTLWAMNSLGLLYEASGNQVVARSLHAEAVQGQRESLGENHPHTIWSEQAMTRLEKSDDGDH